MRTLLFAALVLLGPMCRAEFPPAFFETETVENDCGQIAIEVCARYHKLDVDRNDIVSNLPADGEMVWRREELRRVTGALATPRMPIDVEIPLTQRESEVLHQLAYGLTNKEIAQALNISYETVKEHVQHILRKIGVSDRTQAAVWAVRNGLV